jgi:uncharacterized protein YndB with AHSA1/START domain
MTTTTDTTVTTQVYRVYIRATPEAIWEAITKPEWSARYGYGGRVEYDLRPGGAYRALTSDEMRAHGAPEVAVEGEVVEADPPRRLVQTWRMMMDADMATHQTRLTYEIEAGEGAPRLAALLAGEMEDAGAGGGWSWVLSDLKTLLETGTSFKG